MGAMAAAPATVKLLADGFSASLKSKVYTYADYTAEKTRLHGDLYSEPLDIMKLFELSYVSGPFGDDPAEVSLASAEPNPTGEQFLIIVKTIVGKSTTLSFDTTLATTSVRDLKKAIQAKDSVPVSNQRLIFASVPLEEDHRSLASYNLHNEAVVYLVIRTDTSGVASEVYHIDPDLLHPSYDYDFTNINDAGHSYRRGGYPYYRPCGWKRLALKVVGRFGNDKWLGSSNTPGEWPVSYHGTASTADGNIAQVGYDLSKGRGFPFGKGVYCTPSIEVAVKYAQEFTHNGKRYQMVLQNRVSPENLQIIKERRSGDGEYWVQPKQDCIRAYSICYRQIQ